MSKIEDRVTNLVMPIIEENNFELVDVEYKKEGAHYYLRVFIDKEGGITIDDCEIVSRKLDSLMGEDFIKDAYILEVSSPGLDRQLKKDSDFEKFAGRDVDIKLYKPKNGSKEYTGELVGLVNGEIKIIINNEEVLFTRDEVSVIKLAIIF